MSNLFLGIDVGTSSVKVSVLDAASGVAVARSTFPQHEQAIDSPEPGFAEQDPAMWWENFLSAYGQIVKGGKVDTKQIAAVGISYQMHGLVLVDKDNRILRKSILWCDSRAVEIGASAFETIGADVCLPELLNSPGNFTASKLSWVKQYQPDIFDQVAKFMLPGDFIAMKLSGRVTTTHTGLSEGVFLDFPNRRVSTTILEHFGFSPDLVPELVPAIGDQASIAPDVADELGLNRNVRITYRAGDVPNSAMSLNVLNPGEVAATAGTSGIIYAVTDKDAYDPKSRINTFLHPTDTTTSKRNGILICVNGGGNLYSWLRRLFSASGKSLSYENLNESVAAAPVGADGLLLYPFGNGAERILENRRPNASILNLDFNRHNEKHVARAAVEGIVFAMNLGFDILKQLDVPCDSIRAGNANLFLCATFRDIFATVTNCAVELYDTDGADGAARAAAIGAGFFSDAEEAFDSLKLIRMVEPVNSEAKRYSDLFSEWQSRLPR